MRHTIMLVLLFGLLLGFADEGNQAIDTTNRRPPPDAKEIENYNAAMKAAGKEKPSP